MDDKLLSRFRDCISSLITGSKDDSNFETFQDLMLYIVTDSSQYADIEALRKIYPIQTPFIVGCSGRVKSKNASETLPTRTASNSTHNSDKSSGSVDDANMYEGQPLEMNVYVDLSSIDTANVNSPVFVKEKITFCPVRLSCGRRLLSAYTSLMLTPSVKDGEQIPLLLYCSGDDFYRTAYVYISPTTTPESKTVLKYVRITTEEAKPVSTITSTSFPDLRRRSTVAEYNVYDGSRSYNNSVVERPSRIVLEAEWDKSLTFLEKPAPNSKVSVKAKIILGDKTNPTYPKFQELCVLKGFFESLGKCEVRWSDMNEKDNISCMESMKDLFEKLKLGDAYINDDFENTQDDNELRQNTLVTSRKDQDFTDKLWNVLIYCTRYSELIECLEFMFQDLRNKNIQPLVHRTNKTRIAEIVRNSYTDEFCFPDMEGYLPLKLLIDIGVEKLRNDFVSVLLTNDLATTDQLAYYTDRSCTLSERIERLEKLYSVYELVMILNFYLKISESTLSFVARTALSHFQKHPQDNDHTFVLPVSPADVASFLKSSQPYLWRLSFEDPKDQTRSAVFAFFEALPFDHIVMKEDYPAEHSYYLVKLQEHSINL